MNTHFSIDLKDDDGDVYERGIYLHVSESTILRFKDYRELAGFCDSLPSTLKEIRENYPEILKAGLPAPEASSLEGSP